MLTWLLGRNLVSVIQGDSLVVLDLVVFGSVLFVNAQSIQFSTRRTSNLELGPFSSTSLIGPRLVGHLFDN